MAFQNIYAGKTVLVTGHAGFKGSWLAFWLKQMGANVVGYSLLPNSTETMYNVLGLEESLADSKIADICDAQTLEKFFAQHNPEIVFHLAAQPLVRLSYSLPVQTYQTNVMGTLNVLEAARKTPSVRAVVNVTTDKCYENKEKEAGYTEDEPFGGHDMYSSSKGCSEILSASYRRSFLMDGRPYALATARAGNVIGGGDWSADRLVPDCIRAFQNNKTVEIRNPYATRPWQHVLEPLAGYMLLGQKLLQHGNKFATGYNFGPECGHPVRVADVAKQVAAVWGNGKVVVGNGDGLHEATLLQLDISKAKRELGFLPVWNEERAIAETTRWYREFYNGTNMTEYTEKQINAFLQAARAKGAQWSK
jgi:CDP-glucose 4,6-dehydratase